MGVKYSIIMPVLAQHQWQAHMTVAALDNIRMFTRDFDYELILYHVGTDLLEHKWVKDISLSLRGKDRYLSATQNKSQPECINEAIGLAEGKYIILIGNDNFVHQGWLDAIEDKLEDSYYDVLACWVDRPDADEEETIVQQRPDRIIPSRFSYVNFQGVTIPKAVFDKIGPLDENLPFYLWEMDLNDRFSQANISVGIVMDSLMTTPASVTRMEMTLPEGVENFWDDEHHAKEIEYLKEKRKQYEKN